MTVTPTASSRGPQRRGERRRAQLLDAAMRVIGEQGLTAVTHRSVAAAAGVPAGTMTHYFASKDELVEACFQHAADEEIAELQARADRIDPAALSPAEWAAELADWLTGELHGRPRLRLRARYQLQLEAAHRPRLAAIYDRWTRAAFALAERLVAAAGSDSPAADAVIVLAAVDGMRLNQLSRPGAALPPDSLRPVLERLMARQLSAARR
jgi:DNA-binding transcriptional regulator YbjK